MVDARLLDGSRVNAIIPPLAVDGPLLSIRRFGRDKLMPTDLVRRTAMTAGMMELLEACVKARLNIIICGGTGSGKTTLLNALSVFIPEDERIVTIEDAAELQLKQPHVARLETRPAEPRRQRRGPAPATADQHPAYAARPHRRRRGPRRGSAGHAAGHEHGSRRLADHDPRQHPARRPSAVSKSWCRWPTPTCTCAPSASRSPRAVDLLVQASRLSDGSRRVTHITEVRGMEGEMVTLQDIFVFEKRASTEDGKVTGRFRATGIRPKFYERLAACGIQLPASMFQTVVEIR